MTDSNDFTNIRAPRQPHLTPLPPLTSAHRCNASLPVPYTQQRMYHVEKACPLRHLSNVMLTLRLEGTFYSELFESAITISADRHEALRTTFQETTGGLVQHVGPSASPEIIRVDMTSVDSSRVPSRLSSLVRLMMALPFDLKEGPLLRVIETRIARTHLYLTLHSHHIVTDAYSAFVLLKDMFQTYRALCAGEQPSTKEAPFHFFDFTAWQERCQSHEVLSRATEFWQKRLDHCENQISLFNRPAQLSRSAIDLASHQKALLHGASQRIHELARQYKTTEFSVLFAVLIGLLHIYVKKDRLAVAVPFSNRTRPGTRSIVGFLANVLPVVTDISSTSSLASVARQVSMTVYTLTEYMCVPAAMINMLIGRDGGSRNNRLSNLIFNYFRDIEPTFRAAGLEGVLAWEASPPVLHYWYDFGFYAYSRPNREPLIQIVYYRDVMTDAEAHKVLEDYVVLVDLWTQAPETPLSHVHRQLFSECP